MESQAKPQGRLNLRIDQEILDDLQEIADIWGSGATVSSVVRDFLDDSRPTLRLMAEIARAAKAGDAHAAAERVAELQRVTLQRAGVFDEEMTEQADKLHDLGDEVGGAPVERAS